MLMCLKPKKSVNVGFILLKNNTYFIFYINQTLIFRLISNKLSAQILRAFVNTTFKRPIKLARLLTLHCSHLIQLGLDLLLQNTSFVLYHQWAMANYYLNNGTTQFVLQGEKECPKALLFFSISISIQLSFFLVYILTKIV